MKASCTIPSTPLLPEVSGSRVEYDYVFTVSMESTSEERYFSLLTYAKGVVERETSNPVNPVYRTQLQSRLLNSVKFPADMLSAAKHYDGIVPQAFNAENPKLFVSLRFMEEGLYRYIQDFQFYDQWQKKTIPEPCLLISRSPILSTPILKEGLVFLLVTTNQQL